MKSLRVVVSLITQENDYQMEQAAAAEEAARRLGIDVEVVYAEGDSILQSQQVLKFVQGEAKVRPDAIILEPVGGTALPQVARAAASAGIGWVVLNREVGYIRELRSTAEVPVFGVASDNLEIGRYMAANSPLSCPRAAWYSTSKGRRKPILANCARLECMKPARPTYKSKP